MKSSYKIFSVWGIDVKIHITLLMLFLLPVLELTSYSDLASGVVSGAYLFAFLIVLFSSVLVHELSHARVALRNNIKVKQITLWPLGGMASLGIVKDAAKEFKISIAGPLMSLSLGFLLLFILGLFFGFEPVINSILSEEMTEAPSLFNFLVLTMYLNIVLGLFNLFLPIFPMDGGRVLRAMVSMLTNRITATKITVAIGQIFLVLFIMFAISAGSLWLVAIGIFLFIAGLSELKFTELDTAMGKIDLKNIIRNDFLVVGPKTSISEFLEKAVSRQSIYPVIDDGGRAIGIIETARVVQSSGPIEDVMQRDFPKFVLGEEREEVLADVFSKGYAFVVEKNGRLYGILTLNDLKKALAPVSVQK